MKTISLHSNCLITKKKGKKRLVPSAMYDGLHPIEATELAWCSKIFHVADNTFQDLNG